MTDIVGRLRRERSSPIPKGLAFEAADEIERLRAEVVLKNGEEFRLRTITSAAGAEIERLRTRSVAREMADYFADGREKELQAEIERLHQYVEIERGAGVMIDYQKILKCYIRHVLKEEGISFISRLRYTKHGFGIGNPVFKTDYSLTEEEMLELERIGAEAES